MLLLVVLWAVSGPLCLVMSLAVAKNYQELDQHDGYRWWPCYLTGVVNTTVPGGWSTVTARLPAHGGVLQHVFGSPVRNVTLEPGETIDVELVAGQFVDCYTITNYSKPSFLVAHTPVLDVTALSLAVIFGAIALGFPVIVVIVKVCLRPPPAPAVAAISLITADAAAAATTAVVVDTAETDSAIDVSL